MAQKNAARWNVVRRDFLKVSGLAMVGISSARADGETRMGKLRFGVVTDAHFADVDRNGSRYYRKSVAKMAECVARMNEEKVDFLIELGDFKDQGDPARETDTLEYLDTIEKAFGRFKGPRYHVLGNHDVDSISKQQFRDHVENTGIDVDCNYYSFDSTGMHFVVLDANYKEDGSDCDHGNFNWTDVNIPSAELDWLRKDLAATSRPVVAFVHQLLDGKGKVYVNNAVETRRVLQESGKVLAVFQGHRHGGQHSCIENIHYYTLKAMVEGDGKDDNSFAIVEVLDNHDLMVTGYRKAQGMELDYCQSGSA